VLEPFEILRSALAHRYALDRKAGEGGMATVYVAQDLKHDRTVAIKVLRPEFSVSLGSDRFLREIRVAAQLQHAHILALYDSGEVEGLLYYVMPFVSGESLRDRLNREQQLPLEEALRIAREAAEALSCAHQRGIIHRDIKPENILLQDGHALVADFGIARAVSQAGGDKLTQTGMAVGTPHYMSPEQSLGSEQVDARSDIYSLGCVLYEMLVGQPPFTGPNAMAILARHSMETVPSLQVVRRSIPDALEDAVMCSLQKTPADRYQTMKAFSEALASAETDAAIERTSARRASGGTRPSTFPPVTAFGHPVRPWRRSLAIASILVLLLVLAAGFAAWRMSKDRRSQYAVVDGLDPHNIAVLYFQNLNDADSLGYLADGLTEGLIRQLSEVRGLDVISANGVQPYRGDSIPRDSIARALKVGTLVQGSVEKEAGRLRVTVRLVDGNSGADYERASFEQPTANLLAISDTLAERVSWLIRKRLGEEIALRERREATTSPEAWAFVQQAEQARKRADALVTAGDTTRAAARSFDLADSLYVRARAADPRWAEPLIGRGRVAYRRARLAVDDPTAAKAWIEKGEKLAEAALALRPESPDAFELRGSLRYWAWLLALAPDAAAARVLLKDAQDDLERAVRLRPQQAGAWAMLSHLYNNRIGGETDAKLAAARAYEEDAYLSNADVIVHRLFLDSYDLSQFVDAAHWCDVGRRRFPTNYRFVSCQLWLMTTKAREPNVPLAWVLADSAWKLAPTSDREFQRLEAQMMVAAVLARAGLVDSARHVAGRARGNPEMDPTHDLAMMETFVQLLIGDKEAALTSLKTYLAANPQRRAALAEDPGWWYRSLQDDPRYKELVRVK
jgi:eukaryotic-like serine/threonine-protein kinase